MDINAIKLDEALSLKFKLPEKVYFSTHISVGSLGYFIMLENELGNYLQKADVLKIIANINDPLFKNMNDFYYITHKDAQQLIATIDYLPLKFITHTALCTLAKTLNNHPLAAIQAHCTKNKLYVPCNESHESLMINALESTYNLKYIGKTSSGWKNISYLMFSALDPENLYTLLRIQGKLKEQYNN